MVVASIMTISSLHGRVCSECPMSNDHQMTTILILKGGVDAAADDDLN